MGFFAFVVALLKTSETRRIEQGLTKRSPLLGKRGGA